MRKIGLLVALVAGLAASARAGKPDSDKAPAKAGAAKPVVAGTGAAAVNPKAVKNPGPSSKEIGTATGSCKGPPAKQVSCALHTNPTAGGAPCCYCEGKCKAPSQCMSCPGSEMASGITNRLFD